MARVDSQRTIRPDGTEIETDEVELAGMIIDSRGNKWAIPADDADDMEVYVNPLLPPPDKIEPGMHYQTCHINELPTKMSQGFVPVTREECGIPEHVFAADYGRPEASVHRVGDTVLIKIPQILADRMRAPYQALAKEAIQSLEPTEEQLRKLQKKSAGLAFAADRQHIVNDKAYPEE